MAAPHLNTALPPRSYTNVQPQEENALHPNTSKAKFHRYIKSVAWLRWLFVTKDGDVVIAQMPNVPLIIAFIADGVSYLSRGETKTISTWVAQIAFVVWSIMEIGWGVNPFRRILGAVVLTLMGFAIYQNIM